ncbi:hypothetical protein HMPREF7215_0266, partial [Pyramidobacter piscolens W5455]
MREKTAEERDSSAYFYDDAKESVFMNKIYKVIWSRVRR